MVKATASAGHSAEVRIELRVNGSRIRVSKIGPDRLYFDRPQKFAETVGEVVMQIDGHERRWQVTLDATDAAMRMVRAVTRSA